MKKLDFIVLTILISFFTECEKEKSQCFNCYRTTENQFQWIHETKYICGTQKELESEIRAGEWECPGFTFTSSSNNNNNNNNNPIAPGTPGSRIVTLINPYNNTVGINPNVTLEWKGNISWYESQADAGWLTLSGVNAYNVYLGTEEIPSKIISSQCNTSYEILLETNRTYYWKIIATNNGLTAQGSIWKFKTGS